SHYYLLIAHPFPTRRSSDLFCLHGASQGDDDIYAMINSYWEKLEFHIQDGTAQEWKRIVDTALPSPDDFSDHGLPLEQAKYLVRSEEHTSELQSRFDLVCRL